MNFKPHYSLPPCLPMKILPVLGMRPEIIRLLEPFGFNNSQTGFEF